MSPKAAPIIRLTIDHKGFSRVERLSSIPAYVGECSTSLRYIVQYALFGTGIQAQVKDGLLRLRLPEERSSLRIWNTPSPPDLSSCKGHGSALLSGKQFHVVEADRIRGITFFLLLWPPLWHLLSLRTRLISYDDIRVF